MRKFTVGLLYSAKVNAPHEQDEETPWDKWNELDSEVSITGYERALRDGGHEVVPLEGDLFLPEKLTRYKVDICFNTCEGHRAKSREAQVPAMLDMLGVPYTGSGVMALTIALDKAMTKRVLQFYSIPTPAFQVFITGDEPVDPRLNFPLFAKPAWEGSGIGITAKSICQNPRELREQVRYLLRAYKESVLVEEYIEGREVTTGLLGNIMPRGAWIKERRKMLAAQGQPREALQPVPAGAEAVPAEQPNGAADGKPPTTNGKRPAPPRDFYHLGVRVFPPMEVDFSPLGSGPNLYNSEIKSKNPWGPRYLIPAPISAKLTDQISRLTVATFRALECSDFARVDFRIRSSDNKPFVLEINPLAGLTEGLSDIVMEAEAAGMSYAQLINGILEAALKRYGMLEEG
ncbi:MAG: D-alanine--D-alanine ligase family protein [Rudaea sp.]